MKYILFLFLTIASLFCAQIDTKLFENVQDTSYLKEIETSISKSEIDKSKDIEIINTEKKHLKQLSEVYLIKVNIKEFDLSLLNQEKNLLDSLSKSLFYISELKIKERNQLQLSNEIQNKLSLLKKRIENIIEDDKKNLLTYQLQYAYYKLQRSHIQNRIDLFIQSRNNVFQLIISTLEKKANLLEIDTKKGLDSLDEKIKKLVLQKTSLEIELEKEIINENIKNKDQLTKEISKYEELIQKESIEKIDLLNKVIINNLMQSNHKEYLKIQEQVDSLIISLSGNLKDIYIEQNNIIKDIAKKILGNTKIFLGNSLTQSVNYYEEFKNLFTTTLFVFNEQAISLLSIIRALFLITLGFVFGSIYKKWINKISLKWPNMSQMSLKLTSNVGFYLIIFITIMISMSSLGIDMSSISLIAGALSIGIGFGLQTVVSNFIAGIILMFERTIRIGDIVEINDLLKGTVTDIRIRSTTIKTFDNIDIVIPNSSFIQNNVINWTLDDPTRRLHIAFGVAYGTKVEKIKEVILEELENSKLIYVRNDEDKKPDIRFENMNTSSIDFELLVWVKANDKVNVNSIKSDFLTLIYNCLYKHQIEIPFPQLDLHVKRDSNKDSSF
jgi:potassium-dependent mechanosensitive channel